MSLSGLFDLMASISFLGPLVAYAFIGKTSIGWRGAYIYMTVFHACALVFLFLVYYPPTFESRPTEAREPTRAVSIIMKTKSCQRSWPIRAQTNTTMNEETAAEISTSKHKHRFEDILIVPSGIISEYSPFVMGSGPVKRS